MNKVYIASPFFNEEQLSRVRFIENVLYSLNVDFFSPRNDTYVKPDSSHKQRLVAFNSNLTAIEDATLVIAVTDGKDVGTMFEAGYAYAKNIPVVYFAETLGDNAFNLMLALSANHVSKSRETLALYLKDMFGKNNINNEKNYEFKGEIE